MNIGTAIKTIRKEKRIKQKVLARSIGISPTALVNIEHNISVPKQSTLNLIASELKVSKSYICLRSIDMKDIQNDKLDLAISVIESLKILLK